VRGEHAVRRHALTEPLVVLRGGNGRHRFIVPQ
jgi:hypothetical protein